MLKTKRTTSNSNFTLPKSKRFSSGSKKIADRQNAELSVTAIRSLKREYLAAETKKARAKVLKHLPKEQQWDLTLVWYRSLRTDKARNQFLSLLSSADLHALVVGTIQQRHPNGG